MPLLQRQVKRLDTALHELWDLRRKRGTLQRLEQGELLALQQQYEWYLLTEQKLDALSQAAVARHDGVSEALTSRLAFDATWSGEGALPPEVHSTLDAVRAGLQQNAAAEGESVYSLQHSLNVIHDASRGASQALAAAFAEFRDAVYTPRVNALPVEDREILTRQIQVLEETKRLPLLEQQCQEILRSVAEQASSLRDICQTILAERERIVDERQNLV